MYKRWQGVQFSWERLRSPGRKPYVVLLVYAIVCCAVFCDMFDHVRCMAPWADVNRSTFQSLLVGQEGYVAPTSKLEQVTLSLGRRKPWRDGYEGVVNALVSCL